jgi:hypothetical protein
LWTLTFLLAPREDSKPAPELKFRSLPDRRDKRVLGHQEDLTLNLSAPVRKNLIVPQQLLTELVTAPAGAIAKAKL